MDILGNRIENISIITKGTLYHWKSTNLEDNNATADNVVESIQAEAIKIANGDLKRITALSTDTYNTQRAVWNRITELEAIKHVISIPCESHSLQLIIKDLLDPGKDDNKQDI
jgi:hypothetical protein